MADGRRFAQDIRESGARVVGDLDVLAREPRMGEWPEISEVPLDLASTVIAASVLAGQDWRGEWKKRADSRAAELKSVRERVAKEKARTIGEMVRTMPPGQRVQQAAATFTSQELAAALKRNVTAGAKRRFAVLRRRPRDSKK